MHWERVRHLRPWRLPLRPLACALLLVCTCRLPAQTSLEYQVKAAFLLNFAKFVDWPPAAFTNSESPIAICILGKDPFGRAIDDLVQGEVVTGRKLIVRRISQAPAAQTCQIVFTEQTGKDTAELLSSLGPGVLTVGEGDDFVRQGGIIGFLIDSRHVRFDIDQKAAELADLKLSSKLLAVARAVQK
jgi:hypothetical protein